MRTHIFLSKTNLQCPETIVSVCGSVTLVSVTKYDGSQSMFLTPLSITGAAFGNSQSDLLQTLDINKDYHDSKLGQNLCYLSRVCGSWAAEGQSWSIWDVIILKSVLALCETSTAKRHNYSIMAHLKDDLLKML